MSFTKSYLFGSVTEGHSFPNQHNIILYIDPISLSFHGTIPLRPLSATTASSPTGDSPCSWNTDFWFRNFPVKTTTDILRIWESAKMWIILSWSLMACHCLCQPRPHSPSWLQCSIFLYKARPSAYEGTPNPGQGTQNPGQAPSNLSNRGINSLCSVRRWAFSISTASNVYTL